MKRTAVITSTSMLLITLLLVAFVPFLKAYSETPQPQWSKTFGPYEANQVIQTSDGGYAIAGQSAAPADRGYGYYAAVLIKTNSSGEVEWTKNYDPQFSASSVVQTQDGGFVLSGSGWLLKTDSSGDAQWSKTFEHVADCVAIQTSDGSYISVGYTGSGDAAFISETDENGNLLWNKTLVGGMLRTTARAVIEAGNGEYAIAGSWNGNFWFARLSSNGDFKWNRTYTFPDTDAFAYNVLRSIIKIDDDGFLLAGGDGNRGWLVKTDSEGDVQWHRIYFPGSKNSYFVSVVQTGDEGYLATGTYDYYNAWLVRTDAQGNVRWNATFQDSWGFSIASSAILTSDGGYLVAGNLNDNIWLAKFAPEAPESPFSGYAVLIAVSLVAVAVVGVGLLVYLRKRKSKPKSPS